MSDDSHFHPAYELGSFDNNLTIDEVTTKFSVDHEAPAITWYSKHRNNTYSFLLYQLRTGPYFIVVAFEASTFATDSPDPILEHFPHQLSTQRCNLGESQTFLLLRAYLGGTT